MGFEVRINPKTPLDLANRVTELEVLLEDEKEENERLRAQAAHYTAGWSAWQTQQRDLEAENEQLRAAIYEWHDTGHALALSKIADEREG